MVEKAHRQARKELVRIAGCQGLLKNFRAFQVAVHHEGYINMARSLLSGFSNPSPRVPTRLVSVPRSLRRVLGRYIRVLALA